MKSSIQLMAVKDAAAYLDFSESRMLATDLPRFNVAGITYFAVPDVTAARRVRKAPVKRSSKTAPGMMRKVDLSDAGIMTGPDISLKRY